MAETGPVSVKSESLQPWPSGSPEASAAQLRAAYSAYDDGDHVTALTHLDALPEGHSLASTYVAWKRAEVLNSPTEGRKHGSLGPKSRSTPDWVARPSWLVLGPSMRGPAAPALKLLESFPLLRDEKDQKTRPPAR